MTLDVEPEQCGLPAATILIVGAWALEIVSTVPELGSSGLRLVGAGDFLSAKAILLATPPQMLITDVRLHEYNGLHLVLRAKATAPDMAAVVLSAYEDLVLESEANALGATFVVIPAEPRELSAAIRRTLFRHDDTPVKPPFERRVSARRQVLPAVAIDHDRRLGERRRNPSATCGRALEISIDGQLT